MCRRKSVGLTGILVLFVLSVIAAPVAAQTVKSGLASTEWLKSNLGSEKIRIIDVRANVPDYWQGHIPGAVYFHPDCDETGKTAGCPSC